MKILNEFGIQEMDAVEMKEIDGGTGLNPWGYVLDWAIGKLIEAAPAALAAGVEIKREGGTLAADMPSK